MTEAKEIDWALVPEWAEYVAMYEDGTATAFELEPSIAGGKWTWAKGELAINVWQLNDYIDRSQWRSSLARRPDESDVKWPQDDDPENAPYIGGEFGCMGGTDNITRPSHYVIKDGVEVIDVREWLLQCIADYQIEPMTPHDPYVIDGLETISHLERAMEYLLRAPGKNGMEDVRKAYQYLHRAIHGEWPNAKAEEIAEIVRERDELRERIRLMHTGQKEAG